MTKLLAFNTVWVDTLDFLPGTTIREGDVFNFFGDSSESEDDVTKVNEDNIIKWILASQVRQPLLSELGVEGNCFIDCLVKRPIVEDSGRPGDIDILICPQSIPNYAIALQCKPVKIKALNKKEDDCVQSLQNTKDLVFQTNWQREKYRFYRNYAVIIIKANESKKEDETPILRGIDRESLQRVYQFPYKDRLHNDIGIIYIEVVQPTSKSYSRHFRAGVCVERHAIPLDPQDATTTNKVRQLMQKKSARTDR